MKAVSTPYEAGGRAGAEGADPRRAGRGRPRARRRGRHADRRGAAEAASISRATAYRYFPNQRPAPLAAHPETARPASLLADDPPAIRRRGSTPSSSDFTRADRRHRGAATDDAAAVARGRPARRAALPLRQGRAIAWIAEALDPLRASCPTPSVHALALAIRGAIGIEALVWLTDIAGLTRLRRPIDALVRTRSPSGSAHFGTFFFFFFFFFFGRLGPKGLPLLAGAHYGGLTTWSGAPSSVRRRLLALPHDASLSPTRHSSTWCIAGRGEASWQLSPTVGSGSRTSRSRRSGCARGWTPCAPAGSASADPGGGGGRGRRPLPARPRGQCGVPDRPAAAAPPELVARHLGRSRIPEPARRAGRDRRTCTTRASCAPSCPKPWPGSRRGCRRTTRAGPRPSAWRRPPAPRMPPACASSSRRATRPPTRPTPGCAASATSC